MTEVDEMRTRVARARVARLATVQAQGQPHLVPLCFALDGDRLYSAVDAKPKRTKHLKRLENIRLHPRVSVLVDHYEEDWSCLWWVRLEGDARVLDKGPEHEHGLVLLMEKYEQYRVQPPTGPVIAVAIERWRVWAAAPEAIHEGGSS